jgi:hypothetical protein
VNGIHELNSDFICKKSDWNRVRFVIKITHLNSIVYFLIVHFLIVFFYLIDRAIFNIFSASKDNDKCD